MRVCDKCPQRAMYVIGNQQWCTACYQLHGPFSCRVSRTPPSQEGGGVGSGEGHQILTLGKDER
jgi:hypothetical protein